MSKSIIQFINEGGNKNHIQKTLGEKTPQFIASMASLVASNPAIGECTNGSTLSACLIAASLDLPVNQNLGFAYIIPYNKTIKVRKINGSGKEIMVSESVKQAQFQMGYKGFIQLAMRSGQFRTINVTDVREGELKENNRLTGEIEFEWNEEGRDKLKPIGYVAYMSLVNGFTKQLYMSIDDLQNHASKYSQSYKRNSSNMNIWKDDFDVMARKTVVKQLLSKYAPMTIEMKNQMEAALTADQAVITENGYEYPDNETPNPDYLAYTKERDSILKHIDGSKTVDELLKCAEAVEYQDQEVENKYNEKLEELKKE